MEDVLDIITYTLTIWLPLCNAWNWLWLVPRYIYPRLDTQGAI